MSVSEHFLAFLLREQTCLVLQTVLKIRENLFGIILFKICLEN